MTGASYLWDVRKAFVQNKLPKPVITKKGKVVEKVTVPITVRRLMIFGDFALTRQFRAVPVMRGGVLSWSVSALTEPKPELWPMLKLRPEAKPQPSWTRWASMTEAEFADWLCRVLGPDKALQALGDMSTASSCA